jgi:hypothetical protein
MTDPARLRTARDACRRLGYRLRTGPDRPLAYPDPDGEGGSTLFEEPVPVELEPVSDPTPVGTLAAVGQAAQEDHACLFAPDTGPSARTIAKTLRTPTGLEGTDERGCRRFYVGPDRVHLDRGGLALYDAGDSLGRPTFEWFEEPDGSPDGRSGKDQRRLVLAADGDPVAVLAGTETLQCPGPDPDTFEFRYERKSDGLFHVDEPGGRTVGVFSGVTAMRDQGFHPVPAPVLPEQHLQGSVGDRWAVLHPDGDRVLTAHGGRNLPA